jgi:hypothetical protein
MREQVERLEHHAHFGAQRVERAVLEHRAVIDEPVTANIDRAALGLFQSIAATQEGALAGTARPDHDHDLARLDVEVDGVQYAMCAERLREFTNADDGLNAAHCTMPPARSRRSTR